jgi:hypothetical protein
VRATHHRKNNIRRIIKAKDNSQAGEEAAPNEEDHEAGRNLVTRGREERPEHSQAIGNTAFKIPINRTVAPLLLVSPCSQAGGPGYQVPPEGCLGMGEEGGKEEEAGEGKLGEEINVWSCVSAIVAAYFSQARRA